MLDTAFVAELHSTIICHGKAKNNSVMPKKAKN
jgi:hypothetical protein